MKVYYGALQTVANHEAIYHGKWWDKRDRFWFRMLLEEVIELGLALVHLHRHSPDTELKHIAAICMGWMDCRIAHGKSK